MRPLLTAAAAWASGILLEEGTRLPMCLWIALVTLAALAAIFTGVVVVKTRSARVEGSRAITLFAGLSVAALCCGATSSALQRARLDACPLPSHSEAIVLEGTVTRKPSVRDGRRQTLVDVDTMVTPRRQAAAGRVRVSELAAAVVRLLPGDRVRFRAALRTKEGFANPGAFSQRRFLGGRQIDRVAHANPPGLVRLEAKPQQSAWRVAAQLGERASAAIDRAPPGKGQQLLRALVLGDRNALPALSQDQFRRVGVAHVLAVSGLHLAAIALLVFELVRRLWLLSARLTMTIAAERVAALFATPVAVAFTLMTGAQISTVRALIVTLAFLGAVALGRKPDLLSSLAFAALLILAFSPWAIFEASFQLSFVATATLVLLSRKLGRPHRHLGDAAWRRTMRSTVHWVKNMALASLAVSAMTAPIVALHFGVAQPAGALSNIVIVPLAQFLVLPLSLAGVAVGMVSPSLGTRLVTAAAWTGSRLVELVELMASVAPQLVVPTPRALELASALLAGLALLTFGKTRIAITTAVAALLFCVSSLAWTTWLSPHLRSDVRIAFLDVGHGDAALIELPSGQNWLIDAGGRLFSRDQQDVRHSGPGAQAVLPFLKSRRISHLDLVVISHPHPDHYDGLLALLKTGAVDIDEVWINGDENDDPRYRTLLDEFERSRVRVVRVTAGYRRLSGATRLVVLASSADPMRSLNDNSIVARLDFAGRTVLFAGDIEAEGEQLIVSSGVDLGVDIVKAPHHGSPTSSSMDFVAATAPRWVVISCGSHNRFGFPNEEVVARWRARGAQIMRTDDHGAVFINISPRGRVTVSTHKQ